MIYLLVYYLLFLGSLIAIPYIVFRYILSGDEYLISTNIFYPILWIGVLLFLSSYFFTSIRNFYECFYAKSSDWSAWSFTRKLHAIMVGSIYNSLYISIFGLVGYIMGVIALDNIPEVKEIFMSVVHIPVLEYFLKGVPLGAGAILGNVLTTWCVKTQCG